MISGTFFDIKRFATHDGPGIRTTVFLAGCPLACWWCHNPESWLRRPELIVVPSRCVRCAACVGACPQGAVSMEDAGPATEATRCLDCGTCAEACPAEARKLSGRETTVAELMAVIEKDIPFYDQSGGGVTFSGGEPLCQPDFLVAMLTACGRQEIHRAVDTCGDADPEIVRQVARHTDLFLYDLKLVDPERHQRFTGAPNERILGNLISLSSSGARIDIRIPLVPQVNDDDESVGRMISFIRDLPGRHGVCLLPYHGAARHKYIELGLPLRLDADASLAPQAPADILDRMRRAGIDARLGG